MTFDYTDDKRPLAAWIYVSTWWLRISCDCGSCGSIWGMSRSMSPCLGHTCPTMSHGWLQRNDQLEYFALVQMRRRGWLQLCWLRGTYLWLVPKERCLYSYLYLFMIKLSNNILMRHLLSCFVWVLPILAIVDVFLRKGSKKCLTLQGYNVRIALKYQQIIILLVQRPWGLKYGGCSA